MKNKNKYLTIFFMIIYIILYSASVIRKIKFLLIVLSPAATYFAYVSLNNIVKLSELQEKMKKLVSTAFLSWFIIDMIAMVDNINVFFCHVHLTKNFHQIIVGLYIISRIMLFLLSLVMYRIITLKSNRFMIISDILTISACCIVTIWFSYIRGRTYIIMDERIDDLFSLSIESIYIVIYMMISLAIIGMLLISWFQFKNYRPPIGHRMIMFGIMGISITDLLQDYLIGLSHGNRYMELLYKFSLILIALGGLLFKELQHDIMVYHSGTAISYGSWKNSFYLLVFPMYTIFTTGFHGSSFIFMVIIAYYCVSCLYVKQISITDQLLKTEKDNNDKLKLYSNVLEQAPLSIIVTDVNGYIQYVNPYYIKLNGYTLEEVLGKSYNFMKCDRIPIKFYKEIGQRVQRGERWNGELIIVSKNGEEHEDSAILLPIKDEHDIITNYVAIMENNSETKKIQKELLNQYYFTSQLLDALPCAVYYTDADGVFLGANKECKKEYGFKTNELDGSKLSDQNWMDTEKNKNFIRMQQETLSTKLPSKRQISRTLADGKLMESLYSVSAFYKADGSVGGFMGLMTDVTDLKHKERELKEALKQANEAGEAKTQFLANMSHEIRTPINAVIGMSYLALRTDLNPKQADYITKIHNAATSLLGIINDILDFSKIESGKLYTEIIEFSLDKVLTDSIGLFVQKAHEQGLEFLYHLPMDIPDKVFGDPLRLGQIVNNLISNAVKFTQSGEIALDVSMEDKTKEKVFLKFSVRDTGIGINDWNRDKLFDAFTQSDCSTTRKYGGTGLGLSISRKLAELMGGNLWFESKYTEGSTFYFRISFDYRDDTSSVFNTLPASFQRMKVLVADDNSQARSILKEYLSAMGFQVDVVESGEEAINKVTNNMGNQYQIAFIDWKMNGLSGIQTAEEIRKQKKLFFKPSIILVTESENDDIMRNSENVSVEGCLCKPVRKSALYDMIINLFAINVDREPEKTDAGVLNYKLSGLNVLLAEDNEINQQIVIELLASHGVHTDVANNGLEAARKIRTMTTENRYDMVLMDLQMPVMDGFEAAKHIHEMEKDIPIIALTARTLTEEKTRCLEAGMVDHIAKPINPVNLIATVMKWINSDKINNKYKMVDKTNDDYNLIIDGIDTQSGLRRVSNKLPLYLNLLQNYSQELKKMMDQMKVALAENDFDSIEKLSHTLKGVSGNIGADRIQIVAEKINILTKMGTQKDDIVTLYLDLRDEADRVIQSLKQNVQPS